MSAWPRVAWLDAVFDSGLKPLSRLVAAVYADTARDRDSAWLTLNLLTERTGLSRDAANRARQDLVAGGWLVQISEPNRRQAATFRLVIPPASSTGDGPPSGTRDGPLSSPPPDTSSPSPVRERSASRTQSHRTETKGDARVPAQRDPIRCDRHPDGNPDDEPCRGCQRVREHAERLAAERAAEQRAELEMAAARRQQCGRCRGTSWLEDDDGNPIRKCDHEPEPPHAASLTEHAKDHAHGKR